MLSNTRSVRPIFVLFYHVRILASIAFQKILALKNGFSTVLLTFGTDAVMGLARLVRCFERVYSITGWSFFKLIAVKLTLLILKFDQFLSQQYQFFFEVQIRELRVLNLRRQFEDNTVKLRTARTLRRLEKSLHFTNERNRTGRGFGSVGNDLQSLIKMRDIKIHKIHQSTEKEGA